MLAWQGKCKIYSVPAVVPFQLFTYKWRVPVLPNVICNWQFVIQYSYISYEKFLRYKASIKQHLLVVFKQQESCMVNSTVNGDLGDAWAIAGQGIIGVILAHLDSIVVALLLQSMLP